jgi:hypothetical protein
LHSPACVHSRFLLVCLVVALSACYDPVERSYENAVDREASAFEYRRPIREVWPELVALLDDHGFPLDAKEPIEGKTLLTARKPAMAGEYRIMVRVNRLSAKRYRVSFHKQFIAQEDGGERTSIEPANSADREAHDLEWQLIERAEPERFAELQRHAREAVQPKRGCLQRSSS